MMNVFETKAKVIYKNILANGQYMVDYRDLNQVLDHMIKNRVGFKVEETSSTGIFTVWATKIPVGQQ